MSVKDYLDERWKVMARTSPYPGTSDDFVKWLGADRATLMDLNFAELEALPGVAGELLAGAGLPRLGQFGFIWQATDESMMFNARETFNGRGKTRDEAALSGLLLAWEMHARRKASGEREK